jgi:DNA-binding IscR family transcriptional regulator
LARAAERITLYRIIEAVDGTPSLVQCVESGDSSDYGRCEIAKTCPVRGPVRRIQARLVALLRDVTLADIAQSSEEEMVFDITPQPISATLAVQELAR